ncbi:MAG TPA: arginine--tRNA ligase, partial [Dehalococcoidia bacterium]|nr:arginine--tRNA ligase [Dehalococcoidia bacterium]
MIKDAIATLVRDAAAAAQRAGEIPAVTLPEVLIERPQRAENGDYATTLPMRLRKAIGGKTNPMELAEAIARRIGSSEMVRVVVPAPPGFINFFIDDAWLQRQVETIVQAGPAFGTNQTGAGLRVQVEFVSANPVGPLHVGNGRGAVTGSTLAAILEANGCQVEREYYVNDAGTQTDTFGRTLYARYQQQFGRDVPIPEDGYPGEYMVELAQQIKDEFGERFLAAPLAP